MRTFLLTYMDFPCCLFLKSFCLVSSWPGQVIPSAGSGGEAGTDKPAADSATPTEFSKSVLVMSGGEGYIDFRMGSFLHTFSISASIMIEKWVDKQCDQLLKRISLLKMHTIITDVCTYLSQWQNNSTSTLGAYTFNQ